MSLTGNWNYPTTLRFGAGRIAELPEACRTLGMARPLLVTDPGLADLPMITEALERCRAGGMGIALFSDIKGNPTGANVEAGVAAFRAGDHDGVIAFGGGSGLDAGKAIAFMSGQSRPIWDFEDIGDYWTRADPAGIAPIVAVPTTAGTGSEVGRASVITDEANHIKKIIFHPQILPADRHRRPGADPRPASPRSRRRPEWTPSPTIWRPSARRAITPWPAASPWRACA